VADDWQPGVDRALTGDDRLSTTAGATVFLGHYGLAFAAKRAAPRTSLGTLTFAAQWLDELWPLLLLAGVEQVRIVPGLMAASPLEFTHYPISHSLLAALGWGLLIGGLYQLARRSPRAAVIVGALVVSHWVLDLVVHGPDLPLFPGGPRVGLGGWNSVALTNALEAVCYLGGLAIYLRATAAKDRVGRYALWALVVFQIVCYAAASLAPPPPNTRVLAISALFLWLFIPWAAWVDRHRTMKAATSD
jgi:hypothetical protein